MPMQPVGAPSRFSEVRISAQRNTQDHSSAVKETPADLCDASKVRDFVEVIDRAPLLALIVDHFPGFSRRANMSDSRTLQAMLRKREVSMR